MTTSKHTSNIAKTYGPGGGKNMLCRFTTSGTTADVTTLEAHGCTVARTGVGVFTITCNRTYKGLVAVFSVQGALTAQRFKKSAQGTSSVTLTQVGNADDIAVDTLAATVDVMIFGRSNT